MVLLCSIVILFFIFESVLNRSLPLAKIITRECYTCTGLKSDLQSCHRCVLPDTQKERSQNQNITYSFTRYMYKTEQEDRILPVWCWGEHRRWPHHSIQNVRANTLTDSLKSNIATSGSRSTPLLYLRRCVKPFAHLRHSIQTVGM